MEALLELFAKLIAIALFIERTVEVLWRRGADPTCPPLRVQRIPGYVRDEFSANLDSSGAK
jgi:hypothetical protein